MTKPRIGVQIIQQGSSFKEYKEIVIKLEDMGVDVVYNYDHFFPVYTDEVMQTYECWTTLASLAEVTSKIELGPLVACNSYRNPNLQAFMAGTVNEISGGRIIFGLGSGWMEKDYKGFDYPFGTAGSRLDDFARDLPIIKDRLSKLIPQPAKKIPILIGGGGEKKTIPLVAKYADIWHFFDDAENYARKTNILKEECKKIGRNSDEILKSGYLDYKNENPLKSLDEMRNVGVQEFTIHVQPREMTYETLNKALKWRDEQ